MNFGDLEWTVVPIPSADSDFFQSKCSTYGHTWGTCCGCEGPIDLEADPLDYVVQWSTQRVPLYGRVETPEADFGHRRCLVGLRKPRPIMEMPDRFCSVCGNKLTDMMLQVNRGIFCSFACHDGEPPKL